MVSKDGLHASAASHTLAAVPSATTSASAIASNSSSASAAVGSSIAYASSASGPLPPPRCRNMSIQLREQVPLLIGPSRVSGWGAFAPRSIEKGTFLLEYRGELISQNEGKSPALDPTTSGLTPCCLCLLLAHPEAARSNHARAADRRGTTDYDRRHSSYLFNLNDVQVRRATSRHVSQRCHVSPHVPLVTPLRWWTRVARATARVSSTTPNRPTPRPRYSPREGTTTLASSHSGKPSPLTPRPTP